MIHPFYRFFIFLPHCVVSTVLICEKMPYIPAASRYFSPRVVPKVSQPYPRFVSYSHYTPCGAVPSGLLRVSTGTHYCRVSSFHWHKLKRRNDMFQFLLHLLSYLYLLFIWKSLEIPTGIFKSKQENTILVKIYGPLFPQRRRMGRKVILPDDVDFKLLAGPFLTS